MLLEMLAVERKPLPSCWHAWSNATVPIATVTSTLTSAWKNARR